MTLPVVDIRVADMDVNAVIQCYQFSSAGIEAPFSDVVLACLRELVTLRGVKTMPKVCCQEYAKCIEACRPLAIELRRSLTAKDEHLAAALKWIEEEAEHYGHHSHCKAVKGPWGENWYEHDQCNCGRNAILAKETKCQIADHHPELHPYDPARYLP